MNFFPVNPVCFFLLLYAMNIHTGKAQDNRKEKELQINKDAVNLIRFDFSSSGQEMSGQPKESPLEKRWMDFKADLSIPRNLTDSAKIKKPLGYVRAEPYTIWTRFGEDPVYDVLVTGRPKEWKIQWTINPYRRGKEEYGKNIRPGTGKMYGIINNPGEASASIQGLDFNQFLTDNFTKRGRMLRHNRKHANAWKTYKDYRPTKEDSLKFPTYYKYMTDKTNDTITQDTLPIPLPAKQAQPTDKVKTKQETKSKFLSTEDPGNLYNYIRLRQRQDSIRRARSKRKNERHDVYEVEKQIRRLREQSN